MHVLQNVPCQNGIHVFSNKLYSKSNTKLHTESDRSALSTFVATEIKCSNNNESEGNGGREGEGKERAGIYRTNVKLLAARLGQRCNLR